MAFLIAALRAIVEMLGLCLLAQAALYVLAGQGRASNPIYRLFALLTEPPRRCVACCLWRGAGGKTVGMATFFLLFLLWIGLAILRNFI